MVWIEERKYITMKYSTYILMQIIVWGIGIAAYAVVCIAMHYNAQLSIGIFCIILIVLLLAALLVLQNVRNKKYPQWNNHWYGVRLWKTPPAIIGLIVLLCVAMFAVAFFSDLDLLWFIVAVIAGLLDVPDYYYARKYGMDEIQSWDELLQKHPGAKERLSKAALKNYLR